MIRTHAGEQGVMRTLSRRRVIRFTLASAVALLVGELLGTIPLFFRSNKIVGLGQEMAAAKKAAVLGDWKTTNDEPILNVHGRFFLIHGPGAIVAAYRKCTHLGCTVPFNSGEDGSTAHVTARSTTSTPLS